MFLDQTLPEIDAPTESKEYSRKMLAAIIAALPSSYIRDILTDARAEIVRAIDNDFGCIDYAENRRAQAEAIEDLKQKKAEIDAAQVKLDAKCRELRNAERRLQEIEDTRKELRRLLSPFINP